MMIDPDFLSPFRGDEPYGVREGDFVGSERPACAIPVVDSPGD